MNELQGTPARCKSCGAGIVWSKTPLGKSIPVDPAPTKDGNLAVTAPGIVVVVMPGHRLPDERPRYRSHFATCPNAKEWRKS